MHGFNLKYIPFQTERICLLAVKNDAQQLEYVQNQTKEICLIAIKMNSDEYEELCLYAVNNKGEALAYVDNLQLLSEQYKKYVMFLLRTIFDVFVILKTIICF